MHIVPHGGSATTCWRTPSGIGARRLLASRGLRRWCGGVVAAWLRDPRMNATLSRGRRAGLATAGRPHAAARASTSSSARRTCSGPGKPLRQPARGAPAAFDDPVGAAGHRQDHAGAADRRRRATREFIGAVGGDGRRQGRARGGRAGPGMRRAEQSPTVLFLDEVHRFNKAQQDAFLPFVEDGTLMLHRRDHREPVVRAQQRAAVAGAGLRAASRSAPRTCASVLRAGAGDAERGLGRAAACDSATRRCMRIARGRRRRCAPRAEPARARGRARARRRETARSSTRIAVRRSSPAAGGASTAGRALLRPDLGPAQGGARLGSGRGAVLAGAHARWRLRSALHRAARRAHGGRGHRPRRSAGAAR